MIHYSESPDAGHGHRVQLLNQIEALIAAERKRADARRAAFFAPDFSSPDKYDLSLQPYRERLRELLGWPLSLKQDTPPALRKEFVAEDELGQIFRVWIQTLPELEMYGLLFVPHAEGPHPLIVSIHGGGGTPEYYSNLFTWERNAYNDMTRRVLQRNCAVFAPQLPMWLEAFGPAVNLNEIDLQLKQIGSSLAALGVYQISRTLDALLLREEIDASRIGAMGLSWGGFYALVTAVFDPRIKVILTSGFFNNRYKYPLPPATWFGSANTFLDAEIASLVCPRPLYIEVGQHDKVHAVESARPEAEKVRAVYQKLGIESHFRYHEHEDGHEYDKADTGIEFLMEALGRVEIGD